MPSITTAVRAVVMFAAAIVAVKAWQSYGPSAEQLKSLATCGLESAQRALKDPQPLVPENGDWADSRPAELAPRLWSSPLDETSPNLPVGAQPVADSLIPGPRVAAVEQSSEPNTQPPRRVGETPVESAPQSIIDADQNRLPPLMNRLAELGGVDTELVPWGSSGRLYRFRCRAALTGAPRMSRHFEAVAAEPLLAVEDVLAKVEAWRRSEQAGGDL